jgi:hypothetical protein
MKFWQTTTSHTSPTPRRARPRAVRMDVPFGDGSDYWWSEGNASCDCNRGLWFQGGGAVLSRPCGEGRYRVRCVDDAGNVLYEDRVAFDIHRRDV